MKAAQAVENVEGLDEQTVADIRGVTDGLLKKTKITRATAMFIDKSMSMRASIETAKYIGAVISACIDAPFYCYAYSFGELLVLALYNKYQIEGRSFVPRYIELLSSGGSDAPEKLLSRVGVDIADPGFWQGGLDLLRAMVGEGFELAKGT